MPPEVLRVVKQVEIKARILADEALVGTYRSVFRGSGLDFEEVREYEPGDDIRTIDWNVTARMNAPYIKKYREERELNIYLAVDVSSSATSPTEGSSVSRGSFRMSAITSCLCPSARSGASKSTSRKSEMTNTTFRFLVTFAR